jgi:hypothetical protein
MSEGGGDVMSRGGGGHRNRGKDNEEGGKAIRTWREWLWVGWK